MPSDDLEGKAAERHPADGATRRTIATRGESRAAIAAALVTLAVAVATMSPHLIGVFFDDAIYVLLGKAIAEGHGYVYMQLPGTPPGIHYPPLWPAVLAAVWAVGPEFPGNALWFKLLNPVILSAAAYSGVLVAHRLFGFPAWVSGVAVTVGTASIPLLVLTNVVLSEPLFLLMTLVALLAFARYEGAPSLKWAVLAAAVTALAVLTRTIGGVFVIATLLILTHERRWRDIAVYAGTVFILLLPWQMFVWASSPGFPELLRGSYGPYLEWVAGGYRDGGVEFLRSVVEKNLGDGQRSIGAMLTPSLPGAPRALAKGLAMTLFIVGMVATFRRRETRMLATAMAGYLAVVLTWPVQTERFIWGLWPLFLLVALAGAQAISRGIPLALPSPRAAWLSRATLVAAGLLAVGHAVYNVRAISRGWAVSASRQMSVRAERLISYVNSDPRLEGLVIGTDADPVVALYTGKTVVPVEIMLPRDHVQLKSTEERAADIARFDREFRPDAYVLLPDGVHVAALLAAPLDSTRRLVEITLPGRGARSFLVLSP